MRIITIILLENGLDGKNKYRYNNYYRYKYT